jgi:S1-C subfamily serine protease
MNTWFLHRSLLQGIVFGSVVLTTALFPSFPVRSQSIDAPATVQAVPVASRRAGAGFQAIQRQVESIRPNLTSSTVALFAGMSAGSGVIISPDGLILTAAHVIEGSKGRRITVILEDGRPLPAAYVAADPRSDLGLIKITDAKNLPAAPLGDSDTLRRGQWILTAAHPGGRRAGRPPVLRIGRVFGPSMNVRFGRNGRTRGTAPVGSENRSGVSPRFIATDAPLIGGDSGGPLFDLNGRVVGVNSMIAASSRGSANIHIPVNLAKAAIEKARNGQTPESWDGPPATFTAALRGGQESFRAGNTARALWSARQAAELDPSSAQARLLLARVQARGGQTGPATTALREAIEAGFNDAAEIRGDADLAPLLRSVPVARLVERIEALNAVPGERKGDREFLTAAAQVAPGASRNVVRVRAEGKEVALGAVMSADGDILTKASELPEGALECVLPNGQVVPAERGATDSSWDVALLKVDAAGLEPVAGGEDAPAGHWTFSPDGTETPAVGIVGVAEMPVRGRSLSSRGVSKAYMGVRMGPVDPDALRAMGLSQGVRVEVEEDFPAAKAGVRNGDILIEADGKPITDVEMLMDLLLKKMPGDSLVLRLARGEERLTVTVNLTARPASARGRDGMPLLLAGETSRVAGPFPRVLHHDTVLRPSAMGGPLFDADGHFIGLNIARADRTSTYAIRATDVKTIYTRLKGVPVSARPSRN